MQVTTVKSNRPHQPAKPDFRTGRNLATRGLALPATQGTSGLFAGRSGRGMSLPVQASVCLGTAMLLVAA